MASDDPVRGTRFNVRQPLSLYLAVHGRFVH